MRLFFTSILFFAFSAFLPAQSFEQYFEDNTLRLDYSFVGTATTQIVALNKLNKTPKWAGRTNNINKLERLGNGQITLRDKATNTTIYQDAFSSLFQEWQFVDEAAALTRSFENVLLVPFPKNEVTIEISFRMQDGTYKSLLQHTVKPNDILIRHPANRATYTTIHQGGEVSNCINVAIVPEGFAESEMTKFREYAQTTVQEIFKHKPFDQFKDQFNFFALNTPSADSGVAIPREGIWKNTLAGSHFDTFYSDRYLTTSNLVDLHNELVGVPYSHIIILANTDTYGGGGIFNSYTITTTGHESFAPVVVHEFGHSFAGLADEYFYEGGDTFDTMYSPNVEPWEPNITTLVNFHNKWKPILKPNTPIPTAVKDAKEYPLGVFEGAGYSSKGIYRPADDCRMRTNTCKEFCPACQRAIEQIIKFYTE